MLQFFNMIQGMFAYFFKIVSENNQINIINAINKDENGLTTFSITPIGGNNLIIIYPYEILKNKVFANQLRKPDLKMTQSVLITEGDIFVESKNYDSMSEVFILRSLITNETWQLTHEALINNPDVYNRINVRYLKKEFCT